jgi:hypothetical protein
LSSAGRLLFLTGVAYAAIVLGGSYKNLHYLMPLPWLLLAPALEASAARVRLAATAVLALAFVLSWPTDRAIRRETIALGRESCVQGLSYEAAALAADPVEEVFDQPVGGVRFAVGKHTFVRYALDLGGKDCVVGLSPTVPLGATPLVDGPATWWITDADRYARWRLHHVPVPSSVLFPRPPRHAYPTDAAAWSGRVPVTQEPGRSLLLTGFDDGDGAWGVTVSDRARLLVPVADPRANHVRLGLRAPGAVRIHVRVNGTPAPELVLEPERDGVDVRASWRAGWNLLELDTPVPVGLAWLEVHRVAEARE